MIKNKSNSQKRHVIRKWRDKGKTLKRKQDRNNKTVLQDLSENIK